MTSIRLGAAPTATAPAAPKQYKWSVNSTGSAAPTALGKGSHGHANQSGMFEGHNKIVMSEDTGSSDPTFLGTGSHGCETQQNMIKRWIAMASTYPRRDSSGRFLDSIHTGALS